MANPMLDRLAEERAGHVEFVDTTLSRANDDGRDMVPAELANLSTARERIAEIDAQMGPLVAFEEARASAVRIDNLTTATHVPEPRAFTNPRGGLIVPESFGGLVTASDEFRSWQSGAPARLTIDRAPSEVRATLTTGTLPGSAYVPAPMKWAAPAAAVSTPLLDSITHVPVVGGSVDIVSYGNAAIGAAVVAEGAAKPEATTTATSVNTPLETIAHWVEVTRQLLQDAPAARAIIDSQLTRGVLVKLEANVAAAIDAANFPVTTGAAGVPLVGVARTGAAVVQAAGYQPNVILGNPADLAGMDLDVFMSTLNGATTSPNYWGLTPIGVPGLPVGRTYVMDASAAVFIFENASVQVFMTDSDVTGAGLSGFRRNLFTILAECRAKGAVVNTSAGTRIVATAGAVTAAAASGRKG
jgi:HK97 family phage major capsid protein